MNANFEDHGIFYATQDMINENITLSINTGIYMTSQRQMTFVSSVINQACSFPPRKISKMTMPAGMGSLP